MGSYGGGNSGNYGGGGSTFGGAANDAEGYHFEKLFDAAQKNVMEISQYVGALKKLTPLIGTNKDSRDLRHKINQIIDQARKTAQLTSSSLKELGQMNTNNTMEQRVN